MSYRWKVDVDPFRMPVKLGDPARWQTVTPTTDWQVMPWAGTPEGFAVATDLFYVNVDKGVPAPRLASAR